MSRVECLEEIQDVQECSIKLGHVYQFKIFFTDVHVKVIGIYYHIHKVKVRLISDLDVEPSLVDIDRFKDIYKEVK